MKKIESQLYPFDLYISTNADECKELNDFNTGNPVEINQKGCSGMTYKVKDNDGMQGILIWISPTEDSKTQFGVVVHEIIHAIGFIFDIIGEDMSGSEPEAYLGEWIAKEMYECIINK